MTLPGRNPRSSPNHRNHSSYLEHSTGSQTQTLQNTSNPSLQLPVLISWKREGTSNSEAISRDVKRRRTGPAMLRQPPPLERCLPSLPTRDTVSIRCSAERSFCGPFYRLGWGWGVGGEGAIEAVPAFDRVQLH